MELENLEIYKISMTLGDKVWAIVSTWKYFEKDTLGKQWVRAADSISANISEGYGRFHFNDAKHFYYFARGSLSEAKTWLDKANQRNLITPEDYSELKANIDKLGVKLNNFIKMVGLRTESN